DRLLAMMPATERDIPGRLSVVKRDGRAHGAERRGPPADPFAGLPAVAAPSLLPTASGGTAVDACQDEAAAVAVGAPRPGRQGWRLLACVLLPFAAGFFISYLFRSINALISGELTSDLGLGAGDLGLLTAVYFLTFAAAQTPIGVLLDRFGPRRVQSALLLLAPLRAPVFGHAGRFSALCVAPG